MTDRLHSFTLGDIVRENARSLPAMEALVCGSTRLTYPEVSTRVDRLANLLAGHGVGRGHVVAWIGTNSHRLVELVFACCKLGAIATPVNWRLTPAEVTALLSDMAPALVLSSASPQLAEVTAAGRATVGGEVPWLVHDEPGFEEALAGAEATDADGDEDDELPVLQIMTAAFGGKPKGAQLTSRGIVAQNLVLAGVGQIRPGVETYLAAGPMFHIGVLLKAFAIFHWGGCNVILDRADAEAICRAIAEERCTSAYVFAPTIRQIVELNGDGRFDLSSLTDSVGGIPPADVAKAWYEMTSCTPPAHTGTVGYGTTETVGMVTYEDRPPPSRGSFGRPSPAVALRIFTADGSEAPPGEIGEIAVRGPQVMAGYQGHEPLDANGWRMTGDLGRREADGGITFLGPNQDMIKTGMENVYPVEVQNALREHEAVRDACVFGVPDPEWGQSVRAVVELDGAAGSDPPTPEELVAFVRTRIASYKKPKSVIVVDELPRAGGTVDRAAVKSAHGA